MGMYKNKPQYHAAPTPLGSLIFVALLVGYPMAANDGHDLKKEHLPNLIRYVPIKLSSLDNFW